MKRNLLAVPSLAALLLLGCGGQNRQDNGMNAGSESGAMPADTGAMRSDTGMSSGSMSDTGMSSGSMSDTANSRDTASSGNGSMSGRDSAKGNQTKSGVTNTTTGKSTLGKGVTKTRPDQGEPVTAKGDTVSSSAQPGTSTSDTSSSR